MQAQSILEQLSQVRRDQNRQSDLGHSRQKDRLTVPYCYCRRRRLQICRSDFVELTSGDDHSLKGLSILSAAGRTRCGEPADGRRMQESTFKIPNLKSEKFSFRFGVTGNIIWRPPAPEA